jgi:hypothetical protein
MQKQVLASFLMKELINNNNNNNNSGTLFT